MLNVSTKYIEASNASFREYKSLMILHFTDDKSYPFATASASSFATGYEPSNACDGRMFMAEERGYGSYLPNRLLSASRGWRSASLSDANGVINERLDIYYPSVTVIKTLFLNSVNGNIPKEFTVFVDDIEVVSVVNNDSTMWTHKLPLELKGTKVSVVIKKTVTPESPIHIVEFGAVKTMVFNDDLIIDFSYILEAKPSDAGPVGGISSSELSVIFNNENGWFTQNKAGSLLSNHISSNIAIKVFMGLKVLDNTYEYVPCGEYEVSDWKAPSASLEASVTAYDRLYKIGNATVPEIPAYTNVPLTTLITDILLEFGIPKEDIIIDPQITASAAVGWVPRGKVYDALDEICIAANATITATVDFKIKIMYNYSDDPPIRDWNDDNQIIDLSNPMEQKDVYEGVKLTYAIPMMSNFTEIVNIADLEVLPGYNTFNNVPLDKENPVIEVSKIELLNSDSIELADASFGAWESSLALDSTLSKESSVDIKVYGTVALLNKYTHRTDETPGKKLLEVESNLIQSAQAANTFARGLLPYISGQDTVLTGATRGDLSVELFDTVALSSMIDKMSREEVRLYRISVKYNGGLEVEIEGRKPKVPSEFSFVAPSLVIETQIKL